MSVTLTKEQWVTQGLDKVQSRIFEIEGSQIVKDYKHAAFPYQKTYTAQSMIPRIMVVALLVIGLVAYGLFVSGHLLSFPQDFINLFKDITPQFMIGCAITICLFSGAFAIIHFARISKEKLLSDVEITYQKGEEKPVDAGSLTEVPRAVGVRAYDTRVTKMTYKEGPERGSLTGMDEHIQTVHIKCVKKSAPENAYLDTSTLDAEGNGKAFLYYDKDANNHYAIASIVALLGTLVYLIGVIVYNVIRAVIIPFYVLIQWMRDKVGELLGEEPLYPDERRFELLDVGKQFVQSIIAIVQAPFYALAYWMAVVYGLVNPMGGRKLAAAIERDWNGGMTIEEGYWSVGYCDKTGKGKFWKFEGGGGPESLGRNGFFLAGCYQPFGVAEIKQGVIQGYWIAALTDPNTLVFYDIKNVNDIEKDFAPLLKEYNILLAAEKALLL